MITTGYALRALETQRGLTVLELAELHIAPGNKRAGITEAELDRRIMEQAEGEGMGLYASVASSAPVDAPLMAQYEGMAQAEMDDLEMRVEGIQP